MLKKTVLVLLLCVAAFAWWPAERTAVRIGSKKFTESVILGEMLKLLAEQAGSTSSHLRELGGTRIVYEALRQGEIDAYIEYTGTLKQEIFAEDTVTNDQQLHALLEQNGIAMSKSLGFNNTYALGMQRDRAKELGVTKISDLVKHTNLRYGFGNEFMQRSDGWPGLQETYGLSPKSVSGLDHDIAYQQLELGVIDVMDVYTTDAMIAAFDIFVLEDDRDYFPRYEAVILYRQDLAAQYPAVLKEMLLLEDKISASEMVKINGQVVLDNSTESAAAAEFLKSSLGIATEFVEPTIWERILKRTTEHLELVRRSLLPAILLGIPLGIFAAKRRWLGQVVLTITGIIQTIPSFALLVLLMPVVAATGFASVGTGSATAIVALFLYSLLPIVRGAHSGLTGIDPVLIESAETLGLSSSYRLFRIELPLASRAILSGIKIAAVINVGFATLGALVGAGGYGQPILSGIRLASTSLMLEGAIPAALLAIAVQYAFDLSELFAVPKGLRLSPVNQDS